MKISLIKQLNEMVREKDPFEKALQEAGIELDMGDGSSVDLDDVTTGDEEFEFGTDEELQRIADHWQEAGVDLSDDEIRDAVGDELEQLEYSPEEIASSIDTVMSMLGRGEVEADLPTEEPPEGGYSDKDLRV
jgi:hypothetical protein